MRELRVRVSNHLPLELHFGHSFRKVLRRSKAFDESITKSLLIDVFTDELYE